MLHSKPCSSAKPRSAAAICKLERGDLNRRSKLPYILHSTGSQHSSIVKKILERAFRTLIFSEPYSNFTSFGSNDKPHLCDRQVTRIPEENAELSLLVFGRRRNCPCCYLGGLNSRPFSVIPLDCSNGQDQSDRPKVSWNISPFDFHRHFHVHCETALGGCYVSSASRMGKHSGQARWLSNLCRS